MDQKGQVKRRAQGRGGGAGIPLGNENRLDFLSELVECGGVTREIWCRGMSRGREHWER